MCSRVHSNKALFFFFLKLSLDFSNLIQRIMPLSLKPIQFIKYQCNKFLTSNISDVRFSFVLSFVLPFPWIICPLVFAIENWFVLPDPYRFDCLSHRSVSRAFSYNFQSYWWIDVPVSFFDMLLEIVTIVTISCAPRIFHRHFVMFPLRSRCKEV